MEKSRQPLEWNKVTLLSKALALALFVALPFIGFVLGMKYQKQLDLAPNYSQPTASPEGTSIPTSLPPTSGNTFENAYMKFVIPSGWVVKQAQHPASVNITNGNYILYINAAEQQASGVNGGRFAEIAMGAPSADAVVKVQPSNECGNSVKSNTRSGLTRVDLYINPADRNEWCNIPTNDTRWYFSYFTTKAGGYINYYNPNNPSTGWVITVAYQATNPDSLPVKGNTDLNKALSEMTMIADSLQLKQQ